MNIEFQTNDENKKVELRNIKEAGPDTYECLACIISGRLMCERQFFFGKYYAQQFLQSLIEMSSSFSGVAELKADYEEQILAVSCNHMGKVVVSGEFFEHSELAQSIEFGFATDQTIIADLVDQFSKLLESHG